MELSQLRLKRFLAVLLSTLLIGLTVPAQTRRMPNRRTQTKPAPVQIKEPMPAPSVKCTLTLVQAPEIRGLRLGMNLEQAMSIFPSLRRPPEVIELPDGRRLTRNFLEPDELGIIRVRINSLDPKFSSEMSKLEGISSINFDFMDGHISYLFVFYDTEAKWNTVDDFALRVSEDLHIPKAWKKPTDYKRDLERDLECEGFVITVSSDRYPVISMKDLGAEQIVKNRKAEMERAKEKKNRDDWKP